ncbi:MAG: class I SAM-dependent methyltransferase [Saprospiraceae bacterium]
MKHFAFVLLAFLVLQSCRNTENTHSSEQPSLLKPQVDTTIAGKYEPYLQQDEGSFEHLVSDFESKDRVIWQKPDMVISLLGDLKRKTVADIGAGTGYFSFRLVSKAQKVIAIDIDERFINFMDSIRVRLPTPYQDQFETRLARIDDPMLQPEEADAVVMVNTYCFIEQRNSYLKTLWNGIAPKGKLLVIDFKKTPLPIGPSDNIKVSVRQVEAELIKAGFSIKQVDNESLDYQYIILAEKNPKK